MARVTGKVPHGTCSKCRGPRHSPERYCRVCKAEAMREFRGRRKVRDARRRAALALIHEIAEDVLERGRRSSMSCWSRVLDLTAGMD